MGFWLGFMVVDGGTYLRLVMMLTCHFALLRANALAALLLATTARVPLLMFSSSGAMLETEGAIRSVGSLVGAALGARLSGHPRAREWEFQLLGVVIWLEWARLARFTGGPLTGIGARRRPIENGARFMGPVFIR